MDPYDPGNPIVIATGPLTGTLSPTSARTVMTSVSPKPYPIPWYTHSTLGGWFGPELKYAGFDALVIRGQAAEPVRLEIADGRVRVLPAGDLWGLGARETQLAIRARSGSQVQMLAIGPAGEHLVRYATVQHAEENAAGHSGFGAVWGSKRLKAVSVRGTGGVAVANPAALLREASGVGPGQISPPTRFFRRVPGSNAEKASRPICSQSCRFTCLTSSYHHHVDGRRTPAVCIGPLRGTSHGRYSGGGIEIPGTPDFGQTATAELHELFNTLGLDLWLRSTLHPWLVRCAQLGIREIHGHTIAPEDAAWFAGFLEQMAARQGLGGLFADGALRAMDHLANELPEELVRIAREQEFAFGFTAHREGRFIDEEPLPYWVMSAMMYASESRDPTIGSHSSLLHLADIMLRDQASAAPQLRKLAIEVWGDPETLEPTFDRKAEATVWAQDQHMLIDTLPMCDFAFPRIVRDFQGWDEFLAADRIAGDLDLDQRLVAAVTGESYSRGQLTATARRGFTLERCLLARAGRDRGLDETLAPHFELPCRADGTAIGRAGFSRLLDEYYTARGWDLDDGLPRPETLAGLGLSHLMAPSGRAG
jgi:aldehyde:ferredoxin oxidoreductase